MVRWLRCMLFGLLVGMLSVPYAAALCSYHGQDNAKTTVAQEFADSDWVIHVKVIAADDHWSDEDGSWTLYHLQVMTAFKGKPPAPIEMLTYRDSGGFIWTRATFPDLGGEYLLFLDPIGHPDSVSAAARNATEVNYSCGQSKPWSSVNEKDRQRLIKLSPKR